MSYYMSDAANEKDKDADKSKHQLFNLNGYKILYFIQHYNGSSINLQR